MTDLARRLLQDALTLPDEERADLVAELLATLPDDAAETLHPEWLAEIERRARRVLTSPESGEPWDVVEARLLARLPG